MDNQENQVNIEDLILDPRQNLTWKYYVDPKSDTFGNAKQSAIRAGYDELHAKDITMTRWFKVKLRRLNMLNTAEKVLQETMTIDHMVPKIGMFGPIKDPETKERVFQVDSQILKIKQDTAKFVGERLGKDVGYSTRNEITGADGEKLIPEPSEEMKRIAAQMLKIQKHEEIEPTTDDGGSGVDSESMGPEVSN